MTVVQLPGRGLNHLDLRVVEFAGRFLGWEVDIAWTPDDEAFAVFGCSEFEDVVFILTRQARGYVLSEFPALSDVPSVYIESSLQAVFQHLPKTLQYRRSV